MILRRRLDTELVRRGLVGTRAEAQRLIAGGSVLVPGHPSPKPATLVAPEEQIRLDDRPSTWASRGGEKLAAALDRFDVALEGRRAIDIGASTGGFTDVLLDRGVASVLALDVGYGQLLWRLSTDPRVSVVDRTNFRTVDPAAIGAPFDVVTMDVSFISAASLAPQLHGVGADGTDYVVLVKPQFEVGRRRVGRGGIVRDPDAHRAAVAAVVAALSGSGLAPRAAMPSPVLGSKGNREFLVHARFGPGGRETGRLVDEAFA